MIVPGQIDVLTSSTFDLFRTFARFPCQESRMMVPPCHIMPYHPLCSYSFMPEQHVRQKLQIAAILFLVISCCIHSCSHLLPACRKMDPRETKWINTFFLLDWFLWHTIKVSRMVPPPFGLTRIVPEFVQTFESLVIWAFLWPPRFNRKGNWLGITNRAQDEELAEMCQYRSLNQYPAILFGQHHILDPSTSF